MALIVTWKQRFRQIIRSPLNWGLAVLSVGLLLSSGAAFNRVEAFLGLANFLPFFFLFASFSRLIQTPAQLRQMAWLIVVPSVVVVGLGLGQLFGGWTTSRLVHLFGWELIAQGEPLGRMSSVFIYANFLAVYLLMVFSLGLGLWIDAYQAWRQGKRYGWVLGVLTGIVCGAGIGIIFSYSRSAWAIACWCCLAFALYWGWYWLVLGVTAAASTIVWAAFGPFGREWLRRVVPAYLWARLSDQLYPDRPLSSLRITQWRFAGNMARQRPWTGWGLRNFTPLYEAKMNWWLGHPHNLFLMMAAETGFLVTLLFVGIVGWIGFRAVLVLSTAFQEGGQRERSLLFTYLVAFSSCTIFNLFDVTLYDLRVNTLSWLLLSAIWGVVEHNRRQGQLNSEL